MKIVKSVNEWQKIRSDFEEKSIGFVPTMGALHQGHLSLFERAHRENEISCASIYVNPTQFDNSEDLKKYPEQLEQDSSLAAQQGLDYLICPDYQAIYPDHYHYRIHEIEFSNMLCGAHRPGHFEGVLTVVMKLLNLVSPTRAYFGEKDFQQLQLIKGMVEAFFIPVQIVACPTVRESDGLAMSSRNARLSSEQRKQAALLYRLLTAHEPIESIRESLHQAGFVIDYVEEFSGRRFAAVHLGPVRLIDNVEWKS